MLNAGLAVLVQIEWVDSARPVPEWMFVDDAPEMEIVNCISVGWIVGETDNVLMLAPNIGDKDSTHPQASGFIRIPKQAITSRASLVEAG